MEDKNNHKLEDLIHNAGSLFELINELQGLRKCGDEIIYSYCSEIPFKIDTLVALLYRWVEMKHYYYPDIVYALVNLCSS